APRRGGCGRRLPPATRACSVVHLLLQDLAGARIDLDLDAAAARVDIVDLVDEAVIVVVQLDLDDLAAAQPFLEQAQHLADGHDALGRPALAGTGGPGKGEGKQEREDEDAHAPILPGPG